jgi:hypothetical protein
MISTKLASFGLTAALAAVLPAIPAQAASLTRTFVSSAGHDSNPCTITQPCASFAVAYAATAANGIIAALDPGKYGPLTITGSITINGYGWAAITGPASGNAIIINANSGDKVALIGLQIDGAGAASNGILFNSGGSLTIRDSEIQNFAGTAINFAPNTSSLSQLYVSNTLVSDNGSDEAGIYINPTGSGRTNAVLNHVELLNNKNDGLDVDSASSQTINVTVNDSVSANNGGNGITAFSANGMPTNVMVRNSAIANNGIYGLYADAPGASIRATRSTITGNTNGWFQFIGGQVTSYDDNNIEDNGGINNAPFQIGYK